MEGLNLTYGEIDKKLVAKAVAVFESLKKLNSAEKIATINELKRALHKLSPMNSEPVDCVVWVPHETVEANDYNPNSVAPPEMLLLAHSITTDGYTQPIVGWKQENGHQVIDGFHRTRVGKESAEVRKRVMGYLPIVEIKATQTDLNDRMAATIRHNRARGKHKVDAMSDIVVELRRRNWSNDRISRELGMDADEILRLCQISGLAEMFKDQEFSKSWDIEGQITESDFEELTDDITTYGEEAKDFRTVNTSDEKRVFHTYEKWECFAAGFYNNFPPDGMTKAECLEAYRAFLADIPKFKRALTHVVTKWKHSCEHYLTNEAMNRIAWLGQASACHAIKIPSTFRGGFSLLTEMEQHAANEAALWALNKWLKNQKMEPVTMDQALSGGRQSDIY